MKYLLRSVIPAALILSVAGCGKNEDTAATAPSTSTTPAAASTAAAKSTAAPAGAQASAADSTAKAGRTIEIQGNDAMKFSVTRIEATAGEEIQVKLTNVGTLPKEAMGHNWVLLKKDANAQNFANAALTAKATDYIPANLREQVIAHTKLLGPKESDTVTVKVPSEPGEYPFICSFPAHAAAGMKGVLVVK